MKRGSALRSENPDNTLSHAAEFLRHRHPPGHYEPPPGTAEKVDAAIEQLLRELSKYPDFDQLLADLEREILW